MISLGNYRTQLYDKQAESYLPATPGLGMFVEVKDPDEKVSCHTADWGMLHYLSISQAEPVFFPRMI